MKLTKVLLYGNCLRYASLVHFDWFDAPEEQWWEEKYQDYECVTYEFLEKLKSRVETQRAKCANYTPAMLERLAMAERLLRELAE